MPADQEVVRIVRGLTPKHASALYRIAKDPNRGVRWLFTNPHNMIVLRDAATRNTPTNAGERHG